MVWQWLAALANPIPELRTKGVARSLHSPFSKLVGTHTASDSIQDPPLNLKYLVPARAYSGQIQSYAEIAGKKIDQAEDIKDCPGSKLHINISCVWCRIKIREHICTHTHNHIWHVTTFCFCTAPDTLRMYTDYVHMHSTRLGCSGKAERICDRSVWPVQCLVAADFQVAI